MIDLDQDKKSLIRLFEGSFNPTYYNVNHQWNHQKTELLISISTKGVLTDAPESYIIHTLIGAWLAKIRCAMHYAIHVGTPDHAEVVVTIIPDTDCDCQRM